MVGGWVTMDVFFFIWKEHVFHDFETFPTYSVVREFKQNSQPSLMNISYALRKDTMILTQIS